MQQITILPEYYLAKYSRIKKDFTLKLYSSKKI